MDRLTLQQRVAAIPFWFHSIDLGEVVTPGSKTPESLSNELAALRLPDLQGKSVLDIGAWDGFYSFTAERLGASKVAALDHFVWGLDWLAKRKYRRECHDKGIPAQPYQYVPNLWDFGGLPGRKGFNLAHEVLRSNVKPIVADFMQMDVSALGQFDVVLYLGVLYHMDNPLEALRRLRQVTKGLAVIETEAVNLCSNTPLCEFFPPDGKPFGDPTNFWAPNAAALIGMCKQAGFRDVSVLTKPRFLRKRYRLVAHALV